MTICIHRKVSALALTIIALAAMAFILTGNARAQAASDFTTSPDGSGGLIITGYTGTVKAVVIPGTINGLTVTQIGGQAFQSQSTLTSMNFPSSLTTVGRFAFQSCSGLTSVTFTAPSKLTTIGTDGFQGCSGLTSISLPASLTTIGTYAFSYCSGLTSITIPYGVTDIPQQSFEHCTNLTTVNLPASVTSIDRQAFQVCTSLASITIPSSVTFIDSYAFVSCTALANATFDGDAPTTMNAYIFAGTNANFKITYYAYASGFATPSWTDSGGDTFTTNAPLANPFQTSTSNNQVTITGYTGSASALDIPGHIGGLPVVAIDASIYGINDNSLTSVTIPTTVTSIASYAFYFLSSLTSVVIPNSVTSIGDNAFRSCGLTSVFIPASVTSFGASPFELCFSLTAITVDPANPDYINTADGVVFNKNQTTLVEYPAGKSSGAYTVPSTVTSIGTDAFNDCQNLTGVTLPASLTSIGQYAFEDTFITSVTLPDSLTSIGVAAFEDDSLTSVTIPANVTGIGNRAFDQNGSMTSAVFNGDAPTMGIGVFANTHSGFTVSYYGYATGFASPTWNDGNDTYPTNTPLASPFQITTSNNQVTITGYTGSGGALDIPGHIGGLPVVAIGSDAFFAGNISSLSIPSSVTTIGDFAFSACDLTSVTVPASVTTLGNSPFVDNPITAITVDPANPNYFSTSDGVVLDKSESTLVEYPRGKSGAYSVPATITRIANDAFIDAAGLTSVTLPAALTSIGVEAFAGCPGLTSIVLPSHLTTIEVEAFAYSGLTSVTIPASVTSIGDSAFNVDRNMTRAFFEGNAPTMMGSGVFANTASGFTVYYSGGATGFTQPTWNDGGGDTYNSVGPARFSPWIAGYPGTANPGPTATPENDGVPNLLKYLFDIDPARPMTAADRAALPVFGVATNGDLTLTFREYLLLDPSGITIHVQTSPDLKNWTTVNKVTNPTAGSYTLQSTGVTDANTGDPYMEIDFKPASALPRQFIRLNVTMP